MLRADAKRNRALVLDAASRLLREHGLDVTMQAIADEAGVGIGTVFRRFENKDELVAALVERRFESLHAILERGIEQLADEPWPAFAGAFERAVALHVEDRGFSDAVSCGMHAHPRHDELRSEIAATLERLVTSAKATGVLRDDLTAADIPELACVVARSADWRRACMIVLDGMRPVAPR